MEKQGYRETLEMLMALFPGKATISPREAAQVLCVDIRTIRSALNRVNNPIPSKKMSGKKILIPIAQFAKWLS